MPILTAIILMMLAVSPADANNEDFSEVESIVSGGISAGAYPGAQLVVGTGDGIVFEGYFGNYTYDEFSPAVSEESIYDLASVTKVVATTSAIMKLYEAGLIDLEKPVAEYIPEFAVNGKQDVTVLNLLLHNSGLEAFVPFYTMYNSAEDVIQYIYEDGLEYPTGSKTVYSDLNAIVLGKLVEIITQVPLDEYCSINIFMPLGMRSTCFNPQGDLLERSVPTERDDYWRMKQLKGEVHDEAAYLLGGVSGNAGLFSGGKDLYRFMKAMLNKGRYYSFDKPGEESIFSSETIELFVTRYPIAGYANSRALGWDTKPERKSSVRIPCGEDISENCFGHTGYTGTSIWCDRDRGLIIIFLTNRVYPTRNNNGIRDIRPDVHNYVIRSFENSN